MSDWNIISQGWDLNIPKDAVDQVAPALDALHASFRPLLAKLPHMVEPAVILSEQAVQGAGVQGE